MRGVEGFDRHDRSRERACLSHEELFTDYRILFRVRIEIILRESRLDIAVALRRERIPIRDSQRREPPSVSSGKLVCRPECSLARCTELHETTVLIIVDNIFGHNLVTDIDTVPRPDLLTSCLISCRAGPYSRRAHRRFSRHADRGRFRHSGRILPGRTRASSYSVELPLDSESVSGSLHLRKRQISNS